MRRHREREILHESRCTTFRHYLKQRSVSKRSNITLHISAQSLGERICYVYRGLIEVVVAKCNKNTPYSNCVRGKKPQRMTSDKRVNLLHLRRLFSSLITDELITFLDQLSSYKPEELQQPTTVINWHLTMATTLFRSTAARGTLRSLTTTHNLLKPASTASIFTKATLPDLPCTYLYKSTTPAPSTHTPANPPLPPL